MHPGPGDKKLSNRLTAGFILCLGLPRLGSRSSAYGVGADPNVIVSGRKVTSV